MTASFSSEATFRNSATTTDAFAVETAPTVAWVLVLKAMRDTALVGAVLTASFSSEAALSYYNRVIC